MSQRLPDILWIVTTQWRAQATGYAGDPNARTPALDALAARSINFTQAVTPHPFGPFARAAMLTGVLSPENGVRDYFDPLPLESRTIAHELRDRGYETAFFGKWHLWKRDPSAPLVGEAHAKIMVPPEARGGFEFWEGFEGGFLLNDPWLHGSRLADPTQFHGYQADVLCARTAEWIVEQSPNAKIQTPKVSDRKPWFCMVSLETPHPPYDAPAAGVEAVVPEEIQLSANVPRGGEVEAKARHELAGYYAHIEATDRAIGRLLGAIGDDVLVVFISVHGDMHGSHGLFRKGWPYEESVRVPLLVRVPGGRAEARDDAVSLVDLPAMLTAFVERGVLPTIAAEAAQISMPSVVQLTHQCDRVWRGWRSKMRKQVFNADGSVWLYFDLENDPGELKNLA
jgi:arylsulfatase A-like enzyme